MFFYVQENSWKGRKTRNIGAGFKLYYHGVDRKINGASVVLKEDYAKNVVEVSK